MSKLTIDLEKIYTAEEFERLPEFDQCYELVDGRLVEKPMPGFEHALIAEIIREALRLFDPNKTLGLLLQEASIKLGPKNTPIPDLSFWKTEHRPVRTKGPAPLPDLAVEIWSPSDLDSRQSLEAARAKVLRYLIAGIPLVWAINPDNQTVEVYHAGQVEPQVLSIKDSIEGENIIPGFKLSVKTLFT